MTNHESTASALRGVLEGLAASRGLALDELSEETRRRGHDHTPAEILRGAANFGTAVDDALGLDESERGRIVAAFVDDMQARHDAVRAGDAGAWNAPGSWYYDEPGTEPRPPGFSRFGPNPNPRGDGGPFCGASHPSAGGPCGRTATVTVWDVAFCPLHGLEAETAAAREMWEAAHEASRGAVEAARPLWRRNGALLAVLRAAADEAGAKVEAARYAHEAALDAVYGDAEVGYADEAHEDEGTRRFDYRGDLTSGSPVEWWGESRTNALRAMREACEDGLPDLVQLLEPVREYATVQEVLALRRELLTNRPAGEAEGPA